MSIQSFQEIRFPVDLALGASGGPQRRTEVVTMGSGQEQRNTRWAHSRRQFNVGYGIKTLEDLQTVIAFFEERRGRLYGFRFRDPMDWKSSAGKSAVSSIDQPIGVGDGSRTEFQLFKQYGTLETGYQRKITKPLQESVVVSINQEEIAGGSFSVDDTTGLITLDTAVTPQEGEEVRAGFEFDIPVRFDSDGITVNLSHFEAGDIPSIPILELLI